MPIDLTNTDDPHHSLLYKKDTETQADDSEFNESSTQIPNDDNEKPHNPPIIKDSVIWWSMNRK